ncbi:MAG: hypothetical protein QOK36_2454 [Gaiellales bacterium]|nr:hypothetical protein [Gaiellales bacterium]
MSYSIERRRRLGPLAITLAISLGCLAIPAAALAADGAIDPSFNGSGYHFATDGAGIDLDPVVDRVPTVRVPTVVQSDGKIVIGGRGSDDFMTLVRYNVNGTLDTSFGTGGFVKQQFPVTPGTVANPPALGPSGAVAMTQDASGNLFVAGIGGGASEFVARFTSSGTYVSSAICYAPSNIAYTPRALALRADGRIVIAGAARDRRLDPSGTAVRTMYGQRAVVTLPASGNSSSGCGLRQATLGSDGVIIDGLGHDGTVTNSALSGRWYDGVVALADFRYVVVSTNDSDGTTPGAAWVQRYTATGSGALDATFNGTGRVSIAGAGLHAAALLGDGTVLAAGESGGQLLLARVTPAGAVSSSTMNVGAGSSNTGQAIAVQTDDKVIVGGGATVGSRTALALVRFTADGAVDTTFGNAGLTTTLVGTHDAYITGLALDGPMIVAAGRARTTAAPGALLSVAARYYAVDARPVPVVPPPVTPPGPVVPPASVAAKSTTTTTSPTSSTSIPTLTTTVKKARSCIVPKVTGKNLKKARKAVFARGCKVRVRYAPSKKAKNIVLAQSRKAGKKLGYRSVVRLTVSKTAIVKATKKS